jgi:hypothetical protein
MMDIQRIIRSIAGLKPIPHVVNKIMAITRDPDSSMAQLAQVISYDAVATANLLKAANSAFYGCAQKFNSIHQARLAHLQTAMVHAGDVLCMMMGVCGGLDGLAYRFDQDTIRSLGITDVDLQTIMAGFAEELQKVEALIS